MGTKRLRESLLGNKGRPLSSSARLALCALCFLQSFLHLPCTQGTPTASVPWDFRGIGASRQTASGPWDSRGIEASRRTAAQVALGGGALGAARAQRDSPLQDVLEAGAHLLWDPWSGLGVRMGRREHRGSRGGRKGRRGERGRREMRGVRGGRGLAETEDSDDDGGDDSAPEAASGGVPKATSGADSAKGFEPCDAQWTDYTPCEDPARSNKLSRSRMQHRERHCPSEEEQQEMECLIPPPVGYKVPLPWPRSRDEAWYVNVPYKHLTLAKADQNWVQYDEHTEKFLFPGGGETPMYCTVLYRIILYAVRYCTVLAKADQNWVQYDERTQKLLFPGGGEIPTAQYCTVYVLHCVTISFLREINAAVVGITPSIMLYCTVLHCVLLCCSAMYCTLLYCTVLHFTVLQCTSLYGTVLVLYCCSCCPLSQVRRSTREQTSTFRSLPRSSPSRTGPFAQPSTRGAG